MHRKNTRCRAGRSTSTRFGGVSVEAIVSVSITALTLFIFGLIIASGDREAATTEPQSRTSGANASARPHQAVSLAPLSTSETANNVTTRDGITVLTPPLLVPVVNVDEQAQAEDADDDNGTDADSDRQPSATRTHRHHSSRIYARRDTPHRIVGLAADRRVVVDR